mmetsp:Transcript_54361/g.99962  ORF Transcript_54361/g.99962 Transcript_54361/m.99962 type:complete len:121 (-) Transcript_54361:126-488(-)
MAMKPSMTPLPAPQPVPPNTYVHPPRDRPLLLFITNVKSAQTIWCEISINDNVAMLKHYVFRKMGIPESDMVLIYQGNEMYNDTKIANCKLQQECTIHLIDLKDTPLTLKEPAPAPPPTA